jgi:hypothetical protein
MTAITWLLIALLSCITAFCSLSTASLLLRCPAMSAPPCKSDSAILAQANDISHARGVDFTARVLRSQTINSFCTTRYLHRQTKPALSGFYNAIAATPARTAAESPAQAEALPGIKDCAAPVNGAGMLVFPAALCVGLAGGYVVVGVPVKFCTRM